MKTIPLATGAIVLLAAGALSGCAQETNTDTTPSVSETQEATPEETPSGDRPESEDLAALEFEVSWLDAVSIAQDAFPGELVELELERERSGFTYSVELVSETEEFDVIIDADSGEILRHETETLDAEDVAESREEIFETSGLIDPAEAMNIALDEVDGTVRSWELDREDGRIVYEIELDTYSGESIEINVDAESGEVIGIDD